MNKTSNDFIYDLKEIRNKFEQKPTKRNILHSLASIFDPVGLLTPLCIGIKIIFQDVCGLKVSWDEILSDDYCFQKQNLLNIFYELNEIVNPRKYCFNNVNDSFTKVELHSFSDASKKIYATAIYLLFVSKSGLIQTSLVTSKAKALPCASTMTIPRAELNSALLIGVESKNICFCLQSVYPISNFHFGAESSIVLQILCITPFD